MTRRSRYALFAGIAVLVCVGVGFGCLSTANRAVETGRLRGPYRVVTYAEGRPVEDRTLGTGSSAEQTVTAWLATHADGWSRSFVTYAPGRVVSGEGFSLNLLPGGQCVLNYGPADNPVQVVRRVSTADAEALVTAIGQ